MKDTVSALVSDPFKIKLRIAVNFEGAAKFPRHFTNDWKI
jgi:hypothetical protein